MGSSKTKNKAFKQKREERYISVIDDWCPCFPDNKVLLFISIQEYLPYPRSSHATYFVDVKAWGMDDTGVMMEYQTDDRAFAEGRYQFWKTHIYDKVPDGVDQMWFYEHGFVPA